MRKRGRRKRGVVSRGVDARFQREVSPQLGEKIKARDREEARRRLRGQTSTSFSWHAFMKAPTYPSSLPSSLPLSLSLSTLRSI